MSLHYAPLHDGTWGKQDTALRILNANIRWKTAVRFMRWMFSPGTPTLSIDSCRVGVRVAVDPEKKKISAQAEGQSSVLDRRPRCSATTRIELTGYTYP